MRKPFGIYPTGKNRVIGIIMLGVVLLIILKYFFKISIP